LPRRTVCRLNAQTHQTGFRFGDRVFFSLKKKTDPPGAFESFLRATRPPNPPCRAFKHSCRRGMGAATLAAQVTLKHASQSPGHCYPGVIVSALYAVGSRTTEMAYRTSDCVLNMSGLRCQACTAKHRYPFRVTVLLVGAVGPVEFGRGTHG
jgi:hypothetical protein